MRRSSSRRLQAQRQAAMKRFFAGVEQLERRDLLASVILDVVDYFAYERGPVAKFNVFLTTPSTTPWNFSIGYGSGTADGSDILEMKLNPEPDLGTDYSDAITQVEVTIEAYDDGAGNEDILEYLPISVDATTSDGPLYDNDQLWFVDDFGVGPSFSTTSDTPGPGCDTCQQQALAESQALVDAKDGDLLITTTDMSNDNSWDEYLPCPSRLNSVRLAA